MAYSDLFTSQREIKIPTVISFLAVAVVIFFIATFFLKIPNYSRASKKEIVRQEIVNLYPNQATIFWQTDQSRSGWIIYGINQRQLDQIAKDEKDGAQAQKKYLYHYAILKNLQENSQYFYKYVVDNKLIEEDNGQPFTFKTVSSKININNLQPIYGKIFDQKNQPLENAIVFLAIDKAYSLAALSKSSGEWLIPLNYIIDKKTLQTKTLSQNEDLQLKIIDESGKISRINAKLNSLNPLSKPIIIGKDYDLTKQNNNVLSAITSRTQVSSPVDIIFPKENAIISAGKPLIKGKALPNRNLTVKITEGNSATYIQAKSNNNGIWQVSLEQELTAGPHQVILQTTDTNNKNITIVRNFTIAKSGEQVLGEATSSATPTNTPTPTLSISVTPTPPQSVTPTLPVAGSDYTYIGLSSAVLVLFGLGLLILF